MAYREETRLQNWDLSGVLNGKESLIYGQRRKECSGIRRVGVSIDYVGDPRNVARRTSWGLQLGNVS